MHYTVLTRLNPDHDKYPILQKNNKSDLNKNGHVKYHKTYNNLFTLSLCFVWPNSCVAESYVCFLSFLIANCLDWYQV